MDKCCVCYEPASKHCSKCKSVSYCTVDHQRTDWRSHKAICQNWTRQTQTKAAESSSSSSETEKIPSTSFSTEKTKDKEIDIDVKKDKDDRPIINITDDVLSQISKALRRHPPVPPYVIKPFVDNETQQQQQFLSLVASRDIQQGELIFQENPAIVAPYFTNLVDGTCLPTCWGCFQPIIDKKIFPCKKCGLSLCSSECENCEPHKTCECRVIKKMKKKMRRRGKDESSILLEYLDVTTLKFLICRNENPSMWKHFEDMQNSPRSLTYRANSVPPDEVIGKGGKNLKLSLAYTQNNSELVLLAFHLLNTFWGSSIRPESPDINGRSIRTLYCHLSLAKHDCVGNTVGFFTNDSETLFLKASKSIKAGEVLTYDFLDKPLAPTLRRQILLLNQNIECECTRCLDPTELGSMCTAFKCFRCPTGFYLPTLQKYYKRKSEFIWKCNYSTCGEIIPSDDIEKYVENAWQEYLRLKLENPDASAEIDIEFCKNMQDNHERLGPNHIMKLEIMSKFLDEYRKSHSEFTTYLKTREDRIGKIHSHDDLAKLLAIKMFTDCLINFLNAVKNDCIFDGKALLYMEYGYYNMVTTALEFKSGEKTEADVFSALQIAIGFLFRAKEMLEQLNDPDPSSRHYKNIADKLFKLFLTISKRENDEIIPFLMNVLYIE